MGREVNEWFVVVLSSKAPALQHPRLLGVPRPGWRLNVNRFRCGGMFRGDDLYVKDWKMYWVGVDSSGESMQQLANCVW